jgi:hypothetical protein
MVHLGFAIFQETLSELRNTISRAHIQIEGIELMRNALTRLRNTQFVTFYLQGGPNKYAKILRHLTFNRYTKIQEYTSLNQTLIEILSQAVAPYVRVYHKQVFVVTIDRSANHAKVLLQEKTPEFSGEIINPVTELYRLEITHIYIFIGVSSANPVLIKFNMERSLYWDIKGFAFEPDCGSISVY